MANKSLKLAMVGAVAAAAMVGGLTTEAQAGGEKCYGIAKAGKNDCGNAQGTHSCAGQSTVSADGGEWIFLPEGSCDKIAGGSTKPKV